MSKPVIVCVDDEQVILHSLDKQLARKFGEDYDLEFAESGEEALELIEELAEEGSEVVMVISDQIMPGMKGDELLVALHEAHPKMIKILLTGQAAMETAIHAINNANLFRYLTKPWDEADFLLTVEKGLKQYYLVETLEQQVEELQKVDRLKDEFLANTSHELRTPLHGVIGLAESLSGGAAGKLPSKVNKDLDMIVSSARRLSGLVDNILDFSKIRNEKMNLTLKPVGLRSLTDVVITISKPLLGDKNVRLINAVSGEIPLVQADEDRLQQILFNLVGNAIKFTETGTVEVSAEVVNKMVEIHVSDTGIGIAEDKLDRIFESFEQADGSTSRIYGGTGLGLAITKELVTLHGGEISVTSVAGKSSNFVFTLPIAADQALSDEETAKVARPHLETSSKAESTRPARSRAGGYNILAVDDEPVNLRVLENYLSMENYNIITANSGMEALKILEEHHRIDLVLLDIMMPNMSGYEVCSKIRSRYPVQSLPVIFLTARTRVTDLVEGYQAGANDYLVKPLTKGELLARVSTHLRLLENNRTLELKVAERTQDLKSRNNELETLDGIVKTINREVVLGTVLETVIHQGRVLFPQAGKAMVLIWDKNKKQFRVGASIGFDEDLFDKIDFKKEDVIAYFSREKERIENGVYLIRGDDRVVPTGMMSQLPTPESMLSMSLPMGDQLQGFLVLSNHASPDAFDHSDLRKLARFREHAISAVAKACFLQELQEKNEEILKTQKQLLIQQKMASLGTLTAGVAHEIKNPLNFVNNFAAISVDLVQDLKELIADQQNKVLAEDTFEEFVEVLGEVAENANLINENGHRANRIIQSMMELAQGGMGDLQDTDINRLMDDFTNLAFHGKLDRSSGVQGITIRRNYDDSIGMIKVVSQDLSRVFINLVNNAIEALAEKQRKSGPDFAPTLWVQSKNLKNHIELRFRDNGPGIAESQLDSIFNPFYTTKPTGQGNIGLGLAISYDIVVQEHSGEFRVDSKPGEYTEFIITIPK